ncbi:putative UDP-glucose/GDP-mannose dehydrogenase [Balamuthia mandrillaris]
MQAETTPHEVKKAKGDRVTFIGVGRLGLATALVWESKGLHILAVDVQQSYVDQLNAKTFCSHEPGVSELLRQSTNFRATTSLEEGAAFADLLFVMVDTPTGVGKKSYDHRNLGSVLMALNKLRLKNKHVVIGCTVLPGYIATTGRFLLKDCKHTTLNYNPEFVAQGNIVAGLLHPDMVLIGAESKEAGDLLEGIYKRVCERTSSGGPAIGRMSPESAEIAKLATNCFITMKIAFANAIGDIADRTEGANKNDILSLVGKDSRIGSKCMMPGYGFGGPCFPRDNRALGNYAESIGVAPILATATDAANKLHAELMAEDLLEEDRDLYVFEDVAYKPQCPVPIIEESQKLEVARLVRQRGKKVLIRDREVIINEVMKEYGTTFLYEIIPAAEQ